MNTLNVLGGADIGGSCYLAELEGVRILFDCGVRLNTPYSDHPVIPSPETIDLIFLSHAHLDHIGALAYTAAVCRNARIFATSAALTPRVTVSISTRAVRPTKNFFIKNSPLV